MLCLAVGFGERTLQASATPFAVTGSYNGSSGAAQNITTGNVIATAVGGKTPYSYAWSQTGVSGYTWTIGTPTTATTNFSAQSVSNGAEAQTTFTVTVTDANGMTATATVSATSTNNSTA